MIKTLRVRNFKALREVDIDLGRINLLIGPNESGKTSVLEAVGALARSVDVPLKDAFFGPWTGSQLVWSCDPRLTVGFEADLSATSEELVYHLECRFGPTERTVLAVREWIESALGRYPTESGTRSPEPKPSATTMPFRSEKRPSRPAGLPPSPSDVARRVRNALRGVRTCRFNPRMLALPVAQDSQRQFRVDPSGFGLALCLDNILGFDRQMFGALEEHVRRVFPRLRSLKLVPEPAFESPPDDQAGAPVLSKAEGKGLYFEMEGVPELIAASQASDGMLLVLAYLTLLHLPEPPRLVLIEEPENGIHPKRLDDVIGGIRDLVRGQSDTQVVMTTHSPYVVDLFAPDEVYACRMGADRAVAVHRLSNSAKVREQIDVFSLGEIWSAEGEERLTIDVPHPRVADE